LQVDKADCWIRAVVFDYGQVLCLPQELSDVKAMADACSSSVEEFEQLYWPPRLAYDRADLNAETFWAPILKKGGHNPSQLEIQRLVELDSESWGRPNAPVLEWVKQLRDTGVQVAILSNMPPEIGRYLTANREWMQLFCPTLFSYDVRSVKPEPRIYEILLELLQLPANQVLFLDDRPENVKGARDLGIHALVFNDLESTLAAIRERFKLPLPDAGLRRLGIAGSE
jgi:putative hydrolase of the HAD superfamily